MRISRAISIHAPLRARLLVQHSLLTKKSISILAPSRERRKLIHSFFCVFFISILAPSRELLYSGTSSSTPAGFQSTLPCGSDLFLIHQFQAHLYFNPRSLAGATYDGADISAEYFISIHAPLRERL